LREIIITSVATLVVFRTWLVTMFHIKFINLLWNIHVGTLILQTFYYISITGNVQYSTNMFRGPPLLHRLLSHGRTSLPGDCTVVRQLFDVHPTYPRYTVPTADEILAVWYCKLLLSSIKSGFPQKPNFSINIYIMFWNIKVSKTADQMYNLLAICLILQPQRIDESIQSQLNEKMSDKMIRMARGWLVIDLENRYLFLLLLLSVNWPILKPLFKLGHRNSCCPPFRVTKTMSTTRRLFFMHIALIVMFHPVR